MLKLFYLPGSCSLVSHIALEWSGLDYSAEEVQHDTIKNTEYLALNPQGQVPLLVDGKWVLAENFAIIDYINDLVPEKAIFGTKAITDVHARAKVRQWLAFANSNLHPAFLPIFKVATLVDDKEAQASLIKNASMKIVKLFASVDHALNEQNYLAGTDLSIADVYIYVMLRWTEICKIDLSEYANLQPFYHRVEADQRVKTALKSEGLA